MDPERSLRVPGLLAELMKGADRVKQITPLSAPPCVAPSR